MLSSYSKINTAGWAKGFIRAHQREHDGHVVPPLPILQNACSIMIFFITYLLFWWLAGHVQSTFVTTQIL